MSAISFFHGRSQSRTPYEVLRANLEGSAPDGGAIAASWSKTWTFFEGDWHEGNIAILGRARMRPWLGSSVFDGARAFEGVTPDLDLHCARVNASAPKLSLKPLVSPETWMGLVADGMKRFDRHAALYPPDVLGRAGATLPGVSPDPESTRWCLASTRRRCRRAGRHLDHALAVPPADHRMHAGRRQGGLPLSEQRACAVRGAMRAASTTACSATCSAMSPSSRTANVFFAKDGVVYTPAANGTFLSGITRQRTIKLLRDAGVTVVEGSFRYADFESADEIFSTGNYSKVMPIVRIDDRSLQPGPFYRKARELYWDFAHS